jgi:hypothetical protein
MLRLMMSRQRKRHLERRPLEEAVRIDLSDFIAAAGSVDVQRMSYTWRSDDLLVSIRFKQPMTGSTLSLLRLEVGRRIRSIITADQPLQDWLVVFEHAGETMARLAPYDKLEQGSDEY